ADAIASGRIGRPAFVDTTFTFAVRDRSNIRLSAELAGGALLDVGCYTVDVARRLLGEEPESVTAFARFDPGDGASDAATSGNAPGVDLEAAASLRFPSGAVANATSALTLPRRERVEVRGDEGSLRFERAFLPGPDATELTFGAADGSESREPVRGQDPYLAMVEAFAARVRGRPLAAAPASDAAEAARTVRVLEAAAGSARDGGTVRALAS
ncbi:MAG: Gfo/Idh/MocA family oxidoreductase, partial [Trueperaceae bacterium]